VTRPLMLVWLPLSATATASLDKLWAWGTPSGFKNLWATQLSPSRRTRITAVETAFLLGVPNAFFFYENTTEQCASSGFRQCDVMDASDPGNDSLQIYAAPFGALSRTVWGASYSAPVPTWWWPGVFDLLRTMPALRGVCLDDFPYGNLTWLAHFRQSIHESRPNATLFSTFYTSDLDRPDIAQHLALIDAPILWTWAAADWNATKTEVFSRFEALTKPGRMLGLYTFDFGGGPAGHGAPMPAESMAEQLAWAEDLLLAGRVSGVAFEGLFDLGLEAVETVRGWVRRFGSEPCPEAGEAGAWPSQ